MNGTCPATCQLNETQPLYLRRSRQCANATLTEDCNGADLEELVICNFQVPCPGIYKKSFWIRLCNKTHTDFLSQSFYNSYLALDIAECIIRILS